VSAQSTRDSGTLGTLTRFDRGYAVRHLEVRDPAHRAAIIDGRPLPRSSVAR
jgi:hypothetical protein